MMIREKIIERRDLTIPEMCMLDIIRNDDYNEQYRKEVEKELFEARGFTKDVDMHENDQGYVSIVGEFTYETVRIPTDAEIQAYHYLKCIEALDCNGNCVGCLFGAFCINVDALVKMCKDIVGNKEFCEEM